MTDWIKRAREIHGNKYEYSQIPKNKSEKVKIICPIHGEFIQSFECHVIKKCGCKKCTIKPKWTKKSFVKKCNELYNNKFDYGLIINDRIKQLEKVKIICPIHGEFEQKVVRHLAGYDCPFCKQGIITKDLFLKRAREIHGNKYEYILEKSIYRVNEKIIFICKKHGKIEQLVNNHLNMKHGCYLCAGEITKSKGETDVFNFISNHMKAISNDRKILNGLELDIVIPEIKLAIEFNGSYYHSTIFKDKKYHQNKTFECNKKGYDLFHIFDWEWKQQRSIIESMLLHRMRKSTNSIAARKCKIQEISNDITKKFSIENHIQGHVNSSKNYGLFYNNELVFIMTFAKSRFNRTYQWELMRMCSKLDTSVMGGASKLFNHFLKTEKPQSIISFCDISKGKGNTYNTLGFKLDGITEPGYVNVKGDMILSRHMTQKKKLKKLLNTFDESLSEHVNMENNGYRIVYDAGNYRYIWTSPIN